MHIITVHDKLLGRSQTFASIKKETVFALVDDFLAQEGIDPQDTNYPVGVVETQTDADALLRKAYDTLNRLGDGIGDLLSSMDEEEKFGFEVEAAKHIDETLHSIAEALGLPFKPILEPEGEGDDNTD